MDRRNFLRSLVDGVAVATAVRTWPFRVYSFPARISRPTEIDDLIFFMHPGGISYFFEQRTPFPTWAGLERTPYPGRLGSGSSWQKK